MDLWAEPPLLRSRDKRIPQDSPEGQRVEEGRQRQLEGAAQLAGGREESGVQQEAHQLTRTGAD